LLLIIPTRFEKNLAGNPAIKLVLALLDLQGFQNLVGLLLTCLNIPTRFEKNLAGNPVTKTYSSTTRPARFSKPCRS
jgi:hypothetical protein